MPYIAAYLASALAMAVLDAVFLTQVALPHFERDVPALLAEDPDWVAAILFYAMYNAGVVWFVLHPARAAGRGLLWVLGQGGLLGGFAYATFELTSKAVLVDWTWSLVWSDVLWGIVLTATISAAGLLAMRRVEGRRSA